MPQVFPNRQLTNTKALSSEKLVLRTLAALIAPVIFAMATGFTHTSAADSTIVQPTANSPIILDAGHGGIDSGASHDGFYESHIALHITKLVGAELTRLGHNVEYTRHSDEWLPLEKRAQMANSLRGRLFVSIHLNSSTDPRAYGQEIYFQNQVPVDEESMFLANRENLSENQTQGGPSSASNAATNQMQQDISSRSRISKLREAEEALLPTLPVMSPDIKNDIQNILEDLNRSARVRSSSKLAIHLLKKIALASAKTEPIAERAAAAQVKIPAEGSSPSSHTERFISSRSTSRRSIRQAPFFLLSHVAMPSVLVEVGFLSHPTEAARLKQEAYQQSLAKTIAAGIHQNLTEAK